MHTRESNRELNKVFGRGKLESRKWETMDRGRVTVGAKCLESGLGSRGGGLGINRGFKLI